VSVGRLPPAWPVRRVPAELERRYLDEGWWSDETLGAMVARQLASHPESPVAIWSRSRPWQGSYAEIDREARKLVALLRDRGIEPGEAVAFQLPNWREALVSFAGLALGGYVLVPIVHIYGRKEVPFILEQSSAAAYVSPNAYGNVDYGEIVEAGAPDSLRLHVIVAEDSESIRRLAQKVLEGAGYRVTLARDGEEAVRLHSLMADETDLVVLDVVMPKLNGRDAFEAIRRRSPEVGVLFVTGYGTEALSPAFLAEHEVEVVHKPWNAATFLGAVGRALAVRNAAH